MLTRATAKAPEQDDLFSEEVTFLFPALLALEGRLLGSAVRQQAVPSALTPCRLKPFTVRRVSGFETNLKSGETLKIISAKTAASLDADLVLLVPGATTTQSIREALERGEGRWLHPKPIDPAALGAQAMLQRLTGVTASWEDAFHLREGRAATDDKPLYPGLRRPQIGALHAALAHATRSTDPATIVMPTGTGKTETMLALNARQRFGRLLVVVPTDALREQIAAKFETFGVLKAQSCLDVSALFPVVTRLTRIPTSIAEVDQIFDSANVIVTTMHIAGRAEPPVQEHMATRASALFIDEAHHIGARTWASFRGLFAERTPPIPVVQFTATPFREDGRRVDGEFIYTYPLKKAQQEGYFKPIRFEAVFGLDQLDADQAIIDKLGDVLAADLDAGLNHLAMARCSTIERAKHLHRLYTLAYPDYRPVIVHSQQSLKERRENLAALRRFDSRIIVCVDMLGEGFDLPELKIAALHDHHKSVAVTIQFVGRFTRQDPRLGDATVIANTGVDDVDRSLARLYAEDADWNALVEALSSAKIERQVRRAEMFKGFSGDLSDIPLQTLEPKMNAVVYRTACDAWDPFQAEELYNAGVYLGMKLNAHKRVAIFVTRAEEQARWTTAQQAVNVTWDLHMLHWDQASGLLYISSSAKGPFDRLAKAVCGETARRVEGEEVFRSLHGFKRLILRNLGLTHHQGRGVRYSMYMGVDEPDDGEHYRDFLETLSFLYGRTNGPDVAKALEREMREFRGFLHALPGARNEAIGARHVVEDRLRKVMARTERVASTIERDSMVSEPPMAITILPSDLRQAAAVSDVARALDAPEITEYWKSAPYLLNFMRDYALKRLLKDQLDKPAPNLCAALERARPAMLDRDRLDAYEPLEPANGRMRGVMDDVFGDGLDQHLWIPPSLPYYGPERSGPPLTKALIFSSWSMVPDAIASILSYEAERRMGVGASGQRYFGHVRPRPIQFRQNQGRLVAMRAMHLVYPSPTLARIADPLAIFGASNETLSVEAMRKAVADRLRESVAALAERSGDTADGRDWEWAAPAVIDAMAKASSVAWVNSPYGFALLGNEEGFKEHVAELRTVTTERTFGPVPDTLIDLLVDVALGSPAVCALRALHRIAPDLAWDDHRLLKAANQISWGFRTLFNQHDAVALLRKDDDDRYWRQVLTYGVEHNLQAVLDEYVHYLLDAEGLGAKPAVDRIAGISKAISEALAIRPSQIDVEDPTVDGKKLVINKFQMRGRFAMRLADYKDEEGGAARLSSVRDAFNSPFRPFALATTSVGQEGLDFHPYCYRLYHWNLPGNPVDLEQREGRVHRFKGHAIRLNLAHRQVDVVRGRERDHDDPWQIMFDAARAETENDSDLIPYWIYEGPVKVERRVPMLPFSREVRRLEWLKRSLTVYRLAFGQPRQEDLLEYLHSLMGTAMAAEDLADLQIRLQP